MTSYKEVWNAVMNLNKCEFIVFLIEHILHYFYCMHIIIIF